jgi:diguanylate cyclase (GGDEF)-like protein
VTVLDRMQPRDRPQAVRTVFTLSVVASVVTAIFAVLQPASAGGRLVALVVVVPITGLLVLGAWLLRYLKSEAALPWALFPFLAIGVIVAMDLLTEDPSISAQVFLFFPALYGASQLRRGGAIAVAVASAASDVVVVFSLLPIRTAAIDATYVVAAILTTSGLLIYAGERTDALMHQLSQLAAVDPLTGLVTRRVLDNAARSALSGAASGSGTALILLDVDRFKSINDRLGHPVGDEVLVQLAGILNHGCRQGDIVSRMGGDEIALLLPGCSLAAGQTRAEEICSQVRGHRFSLNHGEELTISVSAGVAHAPTHALDLRPLYAAADSALYAAKRAGRDRVGGVRDVTSREVVARLSGNLDETLTTGVG